MSTIAIYEYDEYAYHTGVSREVSIYDPIPSRWTIEPVPVIPEGHFAKFFDGHWIVITQERPYPSSPPDWHPGPDPNAEQIVDPFASAQTPPEVI